jgi:16S rRNA (uracil1498-N3)-methyltransferase
MDFIIQKAVELGVRKIFPLLTERCSVKHDSMREEKRLAHWQAVVISACEQSGRNRMPDVAAAMTLTQWLTSAAPSVRGVVLSPHVDNKLTRTSEEKKSILLNNQLPLAVLIGPEGGLSEAEMQQAYQHGFLPLQLGPRVLRAETATIAALAILQAWLGDMGADVRE